MGETDIDNLSGNALAVAVGLEVMGWPDAGRILPHDWFPYLQFSSAFEVVNKMRELGFSFVIAGSAMSGDAIGLVPHYTTATFSYPGNKPRCEGCAISVSVCIAICRAAVKAVRRAQEHHRCQPLASDFDTSP